MMNQQESTQHEIVSDLMDGRLRGADFASAVELASRPGEARDVWRRYHLLGEVLRSGASAALINESGFAEKISARLSLEKIAIENVAYSSDSETPGDQQILTTRLDHRSANDPKFRWKLVVGLASFTAVAVLCWSLTVALRGADTAAQLVAAPQGAVQVADVEQTGSQVMIRDSHLDALMAAHKQFGGTSALQMPAGFLRNATFEGPSR
jgi:sigma-E factor negative regulatory protein RseA